jgi:hypothetical protein
MRRLPAAGRPGARGRRLLLVGVFLSRRTAAVDAAAVAFVAAAAARVRAGCWGDPGIWSRGARREPARSAAAALRRSRSPTAAGAGRSRRGLAYGTGAWSCDGGCASAGHRRGARAGRCRSCPPAWTRSPRSGTWRTSRWSWSTTDRANATSALARDAPPS